MVSVVPARSSRRNLKTTGNPTLLFEDILGCVIDFFPGYRPKSMLDNFQIIRIGQVWEGNSW